jgi:cell division cycle protein 20 (cofactor of APC complex)
VENGSALAIGYANSTVQIWDVTRQKRVRTLHGHDSRVAALAWNGNILTSGCKNGAIFNHDVCIADHHVATMLGHTQEVCGLKWSPDGKFLARCVLCCAVLCCAHHLGSGGNDNLVNIWGHDATKLHTLNEHTAAVKALAWCPWQPNLLATGGAWHDGRVLCVCSCT